VRNKVDANSLFEGRCMMKTSTKEGKKAKRGWENFWERNSILMALDFNMLINRRKSSGGNRRKTNLHEKIRFGKF
jgi:hypothetical protein